MNEWMNDYGVTPGRQYLLFEAWDRKFFHPCTLCIVLVTEVIRMAIVQPAIG